MTTIRTLVLTALLGTTFPALAQSTAQPAATQPQTADSAPDPAMLKAMKSKVFEVKHKSPSFLVRSLGALGSGVRGVRMDVSEFGGLNTITVRDFPENLAAIEEAIKRLDVPSTAANAPDVELHVQVLFASKQPTAAGTVPEELQDVLKSLKGALAYRGYTLAASFVQRCDTRNGRMIEGKGQIEGSTLGFGTAKDPSQLRLEWQAAGLNMEQRPNAPASLQIPRFQFFATEERSGGSSHSLAKIETGVNMKEGEHVVVGTSMIKDQGLIIVLTARRVN